MAGFVLVRMLMFLGGLLEGEIDDEITAPMIAALDPSRLIPLLNLHWQVELKAKRKSVADLEAKAAYEEKLLKYACGVLRGALANLGLEAAVTANAQAPACSFSVQLKT